MLTEKWAKKLSVTTQNQPKSEVKVANVGCILMNSVPRCSIGRATLSTIIVVLVTDEIIVRLGIKHEWLIILRILEKATPY